MDTGLAILLFCCTGGIGFIIYLVIHFSQPEDRCIFCSQHTVPYSNQEITSTSSSLYGQPQTSTPSPTVGTEQNLKFCPNCGTKLIEVAKFCEICGTDLEK